MRGPLSNLLVMLAPYGSERASTSQFVNRMQSEGAHVIRTEAKAEVSLTRCVLAGAAYNVLQQAKELEWVFWLDQDISGEPGNVVAMIEVAKAIGILNEPVTMPSVTGLYVNRYSRPPRMALYAITNCTPVVMPEGQHPIAGAGNIDCVPVLCGMGCLLQHREVFMQHCDESRHFAFPNRDTIVPEVCTSHPIHSSELAKYIPVSPDEDLYYWQSEDFDYCTREWEQGRLVLSLPFMFGHECNRILMPDDTTVFPGLRRPNGEQAKAG